MDNIEFLKRLHGLGFNLMIFREDKTPLVSDYANYLERKKRLSVDTIIEYYQKGYLVAKIEGELYDSDRRVELGSEDTITNGGNGDRREEGEGEERKREGKIYSFSIEAENNKVKHQDQDGIGIEVTYTILKKFLQYYHIPTDTWVTKTMHDGYRYNYITNNNNAIIKNKEFQNIGIEIIGNKKASIFLGGNYQNYNHEQIINVNINNDIDNVGIAKVDSNAIERLAEGLELLDNIVKVLRPYYNKGSRDTICLSLAGYLRKAGYDINFAKLIVESICIIFKDEEKNNRIKQCVEQTYKQDEENVSAYNIAKQVSEELAKQLNSIFYINDNEEKLIDKFKRIMFEDYAFVCELLLMEYKERNKERALFLDNYRYVIERPLNENQWRGYWIRFDKNIWVVDNNTHLAKELYTYITSVIGDMNKEIIERSDMLFAKSVAEARSKGEDNNNNNNNNNNKINKANIIKTVKKEYANYERYLKKVLSSQNVKKELLDTLSTYTDIIVYPSQLDNYTPLIEKYIGIDNKLRNNIRNHDLYTHNTSNLYYYQSYKVVVVNTKNCVLLITKDKIISVSHEEAKYCYPTRSINAEYDQYAGCSKFMQFLLEICKEEDDNNNNNEGDEDNNNNTVITNTNNNINNINNNGSRNNNGNPTKEKAFFLAKLMGSFLTKRMSEVFIVFYGVGANGKSTLCKVIVDILGSYARYSNVSMINAREEEGKNPELIACSEKNLVCIFEPKQVYLNPANLKAITSLEPKSVRTLHRLPVEVLPDFYTVLATNNKPVFNDFTLGMLRRLVMVEFKHVIPESKRIKNYDKILLEEERSGILNLMIAGLQRYLAEDGELVIPDVVKKSTAEWIWSLDIIQEFIDRYTICTYNENDKIPFADVYERFKWFCKLKAVKEEEVPSRKEFSQRLKDKGFTTVRKKGDKKTYVCRIKWKDKADDYEPSDIDTGTGTGTGIRPNTSNTPNKEDPSPPLSTATNTTTPLSPTTPTTTTIQSTTPQHNRQTLNGYIDNNNGNNINNISSNDNVVPTQTRQYILAELNQLVSYIQKNFVDYDGVYLCRRCNYSHTPAVLCGCEVRLEELGTISIPLQEDHELIRILQELCWHASEHDYQEWMSSRYPRTVGQNTTAATTTNQQAGNQ